jgi:hypothetical protein
MHATSRNPATAPKPNERIEAELLPVETEVWCSTSNERIGAWTPASSSFDACTILLL